MLHRLSRGCSGRNPRARGRRAIGPAHSEGAACAKRCCPRAACLSCRRRSARSAAPLPATRWRHVRAAGPWQVGKGNRYPPRSGLGFRMFFANRRRPQRISYVPESLCGDFVGCIFFFSLFFSLLVPARTRLAFRFRLRVSKAPGGAGPAFGPSRRHGDAVPAALRRPRVPQHQAEAAGMGAHALGHDGLRAGGGVVLPHHRRYRRAAPGEAAAMEVAWLNVLRRPAGHRMRCLPASCRLGSPPSLETPN